MISLQHAPDVKKKKNKDGIIDEPVYKFINHHGKTRCIRKFHFIEKVNGKKRR